MRDRQRPKVGEILVRAGVIDQHQLRAALGEQARWGRPLGATLVKLGFVEETQLVRALASQVGLPMAILEGKRIPAEVLALVPREIADREKVIPLFVKEEAGRRHLYVGVEDPGNLELFDDLAFRTGMEVRPVLVGPSELFEAIDRCYHRAPQAGTGAQPGVAVVSPGTAVVTPGTEELARHWSRSAPEAHAEAVDAPVAEVARPAEPAAEGGGERPSPPGAEVGATAGRTIGETPAAPADAAAPCILQEVGAPGEAEPPASPLAPASPAPASPTPPAASPPASSTAGTASPPAEDAAPTVARPHVILRALAEILIEKGVMTREELQQRIRDLSR